MAWPRAESDVWGDLISRLRRERQRQGFSIPELEEKLGVCRNHIDKLENGIARPSAFLLSCWAWALGLRLQLVELNEAELEKGPPAGGNGDRIRRRLPIAGPLTL